MTDKTSPDPPKTRPEEGMDGTSGLTRFLQDWTALWREELRAQARAHETMPLGGPPGGMLGGLPNTGIPGGGMPGGGMSGAVATAIEQWRAAMMQWPTTAPGQPLAAAASRDIAGTPGAAPAAAAPDARDAAVERLARRVDELEARLAKLESTRRRRG